jgi:ABC-type amino acid transport system permease subunit
MGCSRRAGTLAVVEMARCRIAAGIQGHNPPLANIALGYFKASSVLALLSVGELMTVAVRISNYTFKPIETLTTVGAVYLVLGYFLSWLTFRVERLFKTTQA